MMSGADNDDAAHREDNKGILLPLLVIVFNRAGRHSPFPLSVPQISSSSSPSVYVA